jgi:hypothetical protein
MYDVFFLSYDEPMADKHWELLKSKVPSARHMAHISGIHEAHKACATRSRTRMFWVIDADNELLNYDFQMTVPEWDQNYVHLWHAENPLNGLVYGWGGVKLFPKSVVLGMHDIPLDMTTSFELKIMDEVKSITHFNYSPFETWRSAFRECVKLSRSSDQECLDRLAVWTSHASGPYAEYCLAGARDGVAYFESCSYPLEYRRINDYAWLRNRFAERFS